MSEQNAMQSRERPLVEDVAPVPAPSIALHIEELALHGFPPGAARYDIGAAIERELARLLAEQGLPPGLDRNQIIGRLDGGSFEIAPGSRPDTIGKQIAEAVYRGLRR